LKSYIFCDITTCSPFKSTDVSEESVAAGSKQSFTWYLVNADFVFSLFFDPEDIGEMFL
jgi:hypothetical protein